MGLQSLWQARIFPNKYYDTTVGKVGKVREKNKGVQSPDFMEHDVV